MGSTLNSVTNVYVELSVVLGKSSMPIHQLLKMGRGAVIELGTRQNEEIWVLANNVPIARGEIIVQSPLHPFSRPLKRRTYSFDQL